MAFGACLPAALVADYAEMLRIAIEIFNNNFSPQDILKSSADIDKMMVKSYALMETSPGPNYKTKREGLSLNQQALLD